MVEDVQEEVDLEQPDVEEEEIDNEASSSSSSLEDVKKRYEEQQQGDVLASMASSASSSSSSSSVNEPGVETVKEIQSELQPRYIDDDKIYATGKVLRYEFKPRAVNAQRILNEYEIGLNEKGVVFVKLGNNAWQYATKTFGGSGKMNELYNDWLKKNKTQLIFPKRYAQKKIVKI